MDKSAVIVSELYPIVKANLAKKENQQLIRRTTGAYVDRNNGALSKIGPMDQLIFLEEDRRPIYEASGLTPAMISATLKKSSAVKASGRNMQDPFNTACALCIKYFTDTNNKDMSDVTLLYFTLSFYWTLYKKYFKFDPTESVMAYTVNNMSNKFKIKQTGHVLGTLIKTSEGAYIIHKPRLMEGTDFQLVRFILDVKTRQNSLLKKIRNEYGRVKEEGNYLNVDGDSFEKDNYHEADNNTYAINRMSNAVLMKLTVHGPDSRFVKLSAQMCTVSTNELKNYLNTMVTNEHREDILTVIESILYLFLFDDQNDVREVRSQKFIMYCLEVYKKSNTTDQNIIKIKTILDKWLEDLGTYKKTQRLATINNFRRALFTFFIISIQQNSQV